MRLIVALIIGGAALGTVVYYVHSHCWNPENLQVNWTPNVITVDDTTITVTVKDEDGHPVKGANIVVTGLHTGDSSNTNDLGSVTLSLSGLSIPEYRNEAYLDIEATASGCYKKYEQEDAIKVVRG